MELRKVVLAALLLITQTSFASISNLDPNNQRVRPDSLSKPCTKASPLTTTAPTAHKIATNNTIATEVGFESNRTGNRNRGY